LIPDSKFLQADQKKLHISQITSVETGVGFSATGPVKSGNIGAKQKGEQVLKTCSP